MKTVQGDLIEKVSAGEFDAIIHGCNCRCTMGAGIARKLASTWPAVQQADDSTAGEHHYKLGSFSVCHLPAGILVFNAYTQLNPGQCLDMEALKTSMDRISRLLAPGVRIGIPKIGCGIAGGDWAVVGPAISERFEGHDLTVVEYGV